MFRGWYNCLERLVKDVVIGFAGLGIILTRGRAADSAFIKILNRKHT